MRTPFFPPWRQFLGPLGRRVVHLRKQSLLLLDQLFGQLIDPGLLSQADEGPNSRERIYSIRRTFWGFLYQVLTPACPCRSVVRQIQALFHLHDLGCVDEGTGGYCQARLRLPNDTLQRIRHAVAAHAEKLLPQAKQLWFGLRPKVIDGSTLSLPDTLKNQRAYPQSRTQKPGCGFPLLKLVGIFSLGSGVLLDYAKGNKHNHELALLQKLLNHFKPRDLAVADRGFSSYVLIALLALRGVESLFRLHQMRASDLRQGKRLGKNDRSFVWRKPWLKPRYLPNTVWKAIPDELSVRVLRFKLKIPGYRSESIILVTTLVDARVYPAEELARLYARRWRVELWFRDLKSSMGMEILSCKSPKMVHKELEMFFIGYNLIRALMAESAAIYDVPLEGISFKGAVDAARQFSNAIAQARSKKKRSELVADLLRILAKDEVPDRPERVEPRAVKRRQKPYPLLNKPRHQYKEIAHRNRCRSSTPQENKGLI